MTTADLARKCFELAGEAILVLAFAFAVILAAPFMILGWIITRMGWEL